MLNKLEKKGKMRYLGSKFTAYAAFLAPCFSIIPIIIIIFVLKAELSISTIFLSFICISCSFLWTFFCWTRRNQLYSWGLFTDSAVYVSGLFQKRFSISYNCCQGCGIGFYRHAFLNLENCPFGSNCYFIFLSKNPFDEKFRNRINLWLPSSACLKVSFDKRLYDFLINKLPKKQSRMLELDYNRFLNT